MNIETAAENVLIAECMEQAGFEFYLPPAGSVDTGIGAGAYALFVGEITVESAAITGYGPYLDSPFFSHGDSESDDPADQSPGYQAMVRNYEYYTGLSAEDQTAYEVAFDGGPDGERVTLDDGTGVPDEGCIADASREVLGDQRLDVIMAFNEVQFLTGQINLAEDPGVATAGNDWRACMADSGYHFDNPGDAIDAGVALRGDAVEPTAEEIDQAVADATCQAEADLPGAVQGAYDRISQAVIEENLDVLLGWQDLEAMILERSSEVLGVTFEPSF